MGSVPAFEPKARCAFTSFTKRERKQTRLAVFDRQELGRVGALVVLLSVRRHLTHPVVQLAATAVFLQLWQGSLPFG